MAKLDPTKMKDWEIAEASEDDMRTVYDIADDLAWKKWNCFHTATLSGSSTT